MNYRIIGLIATTKDTTTFTTLYLACDFPEYVVENAIRCEGSETVKVVTVLNCAMLKLGDNISLTYAPSASGKPRLVAIKVVND